MDFAIETTFDIKFTTRRFSSGAPFALASGAISAYPDNSTTQITAGITLSADFDGVTGLNNVRVVATAANGYAAGSSYDLVITTGTVDSVSVVGEIVGSFTLGREAAYGRLGAPAGASVSADVAAVKVDTAAILVDTGTTLDGKIDTIGTNLDAVLVDTGTTLQGELDGIQADTEDIQARIPAALTANGNIKADTLRVGGTVQTGGDLATMITAVDDIIDTEIGLIDTALDAVLAMLDDARTEPGQGAPAVNPDAMTKLDYLYKAWRNKKDNNGTETKLYADNGTTVDHKQATSEAAGTVTKAEWITGA